MKRTVPFSSIPDRPHRITLHQIFNHLSDKIDFVCRNILSGIIRQLQQQNNKQNFIQIFNVKLLFIANFASSSWLSLFQCTSATPSWQCPAQRGKELTRPWWASLAKLSRVLIRSVGSVVLIQCQGSQFPKLKILWWLMAVAMFYLALFNLNNLSSLLVDMGPAVLNGGLSTLIAFILLLSSDSHVFSSFFKIFMLVVLFGVSFQWQQRCYYHRCFPR